MGDAVRPAVAVTTVGSVGGNGSLDVVARVRFVGIRLSHYWRSASKRTKNDRGSDESRLEIHNQNPFVLALVSVFAAGCFVLAMD